MDYDAAVCVGVLGNIQQTSNNNFQSFNHDNAVLNLQN